MTRPTVLLLFASLSFGLLIAPSTVAAQGGDVRSIRVSTFATLPLVAPLNPGNPEGMTADDFGLLYVNTFDTSNICFSLPASPPNAFNYIFTYDRWGSLVAQTPFVPCGAPLGMQAVGNKLYVIDVFYGQVDRYQLPLTAISTPDATYNICGGFLVAFGLPVKNGGPFCALNDMKLGPDGRLYMADNGAGPAFVFSTNFETGRIWELNPADGTSGIFYSNAVLNVDPNSAPPFGVAAAVFDPEGENLYMSNFSTSFVFTLGVQPVNLGEPPSPTNLLVPPTGSPSVLFHDPSILLGPNHMAFDGDGEKHHRRRDAESDHLWITSGENNQVVELDSRNGAVLATAGSFCGLTDDGAPKCLLQPANIVKLGDTMYVDNEANPGLNCLNTEAGPPGSLVPAGLPPLCGPGITPSATWTDLRLYTISRFFPNGRHCDDHDNQCD
jgi:DNA-binding beta-propeller fold protein YncE